MQISEENIKKALNASGYLLESRIAKWFSANDFFIEPNFTFYDSLFQKSREIDLFVENCRSYADHEKKIMSNINFVVETINNDRPLVFFFNRRYIDSDKVFEQINHISAYPGTENDYLYLIDCGKLHYFNNIIATQYCSFKEKKSGSKECPEYMAYHPDDLYDNFRKLLFCSKSTAQDYEKIYSNKWNSLIIFQPLLVIKDELFGAEIDGENVILTKEKMIPFSFNHTLSNKHYSIIIDVITEDYLEDYVQMKLDETKLIYEDILKIHEKC